MLVVKLDAIDSTNDFLKQLVRESNADTFTVVIANNQTNGKGQFGSEWHSEPGKNLTMSILLKDLLLEKSNLFDLNVLVSVAVFQVLNELQIPNIAIKWPNDIMAGGKKVAGILIENSIKSDGTITAVVGIGLNLNQVSFENLPNASSLQCITSLNYDPEEIAMCIRETLQFYLSLLYESPDSLWGKYDENLFKKNESLNFVNATGNQFKGVIKKVNKDGRLEVISSTNKRSYFDLKQIQMMWE